MPIRACWMQLREEAPYPGMWIFPPESPVDFRIFSTPEELWFARRR